jgi:DsbC/DsbD-like thiol-disulfide interchange protein
MTRRNFSIHMSEARYMSKCSSGAFDLAMGGYGGSVSRIPPSPLHPGLRPTRRSAEQGTATHGSAGRLCARLAAYSLAYFAAMGSGYAEPQTGSAREPGAISRHPVRAELVAEHASVQPQGSTRIGVRFDLEPGWHIYAKDSGDAGLPTSVEWSAPAGASIGPLRWPTPQEFNDPGDIRTYGYSGTIVLFSTFTPPPGAAPGATIPISSHVKWLACNAICIPGSAALEFALPITADPPALSPHAELFDQVPG